MHYFIYFLFFLLAFFIPQVTHAADSDIVITEIAAYESSDHEWIEIHNKGANPVDLTGWKFFEDGTNHGLAAYRGGMSIPAGGYAVIADSAAVTATDYPSYQGILIDSSWTSLNESGELIGIKNASGTLIEQFTYISAPDHSLERNNPAIAGYTSANWKEHASGNSIGAPSSQQNAQQTGASPSPVESSSFSQQPQPTSKPGKGSVVINELVADPSDEEKEWIELYNVLAQSVDLSGWSITNGSSKTLLLAGILQGGGNQKYLAIETPGSLLKNLGDKISLLDSNRDVIDSVSYGSWDDGVLGDNAPRAVNPLSLARKTDGYNTRMNSNDFVVTVTPTKGSANTITPEPIIQSGQSVVKEPRQKNQLSVVISELLPNPTSHNPKDEFIELTNESTSDIDLAGWRLTDEEEHEYIISKKEMDATVLRPKEYIVISRDVSGIALNNTGGEIVKLYEPGPLKAFFTVRYSEDALSNMSYARNAQGHYVWSVQATPGAQNNIVIPNRPPLLSIDWPKTIIEGEEAIFDATDTFDPDNDPLHVEWDFGDGVKDEGLYVSHMFTKTGNTTVTARVRDAKQEKNATKKFTILAQKESAILQQQSVQSSQKEEIMYGVVLNELMPNPTGSDDNEFIELKNSGIVPADISDWMLSSKISAKRYVFGRDTHINPGGLLTVFKIDLPFSQSNTYDFISLLSPSDKEIDSIDFDDAPSGMSYTRTTHGDWLWTKRITPGAENNVDDVYEKRNEEYGIHEPQSMTIAKSAPKKITQQGIECSIVVIPGLFGKNSAYCADPPLRLRFSSQTIPALREGDRVRLTGKLPHPKNQQLLTIKNATDIVVLAHGNAIVPKELKITDTSDDDLASLIRVSGIISRIQWPSVWLGDGEHEIRAYVYKSTLIEKPSALPGDSIDITGILDKKPSGYRLLPRSPQDIHITIKERSSIMKNSPEGDDAAKPAQKSGYILATLAALAIVSGGLIMQYLGKKG